MITTEHEKTITHADNDKLTSRDSFYNDVMASLALSPKQLPSKYFYDTAGDKLFQEIMNCEDYYLTRCEMEIFTRQTEHLVTMVMAGGQPFDLIELGPGDCTKSIHLFKGLAAAGAQYSYIPVDISGHVISDLERKLPEQVPGMKVKGMNGDYFEMLKALSGTSATRKVVLCLGANIGNMTVADSHKFCRDLRQYLSVGDLAIIGFDLKKNPAVIRAAYFDRGGITSRFNMNLLQRMNNELHTDFDLGQFEHYCSYDPIAGACKSYLVSLADAVVNFGTATVAFKKNECIWMEISQKHTPEQIDEMAKANGYRPGQYLTDDKGWFMDAIWTAC